MRKFFTPFAALIVLSACKGPAPSEAETKTDLSTYYLVRHAEKQKGDDPGLTEIGHARAKALRDKLAGKNITHIHSSDYKRTRLTAAPLAEALGLEVQIYDARDLLTTAETLKATPGAHLVVGHSNTTPQLAALVSGQIMESMPETEYNRFIEIRLNKDGSPERFDVSTFGAGD